MKIAISCFLLLLFSPAIIAQQLTGLWMGELTNDSTKKNQHFELALSEYKGKVTGYSYTTFIEGDHYYYSIKRIKATSENNTWIIEDDKMIANNFPEKAAKGVRQTTTFSLNKKDSTWQMNGSWKTNQTKTYYALSGSMQMSEEKDKDKSNLLAHLQELQLENTVAFYQPEKRLASAGQLRANKNEIAADKIDYAIKNNGKPDITLPAIRNSETVAERSVEIIQTVFFKSDSLVLALYDNGEIDGDTVSVYLNKTLILSKERLKTNAVKKTIYPAAGSETFQLVLFAENLGKYPPNTGLLVIHDGEDVYQVRFSADMQRSPAIIFKRKEK